MAIKLNKRAMSIPIVLLVLLTLVLITTSLFYFNMKQKNVRETMMLPDEIDMVYVKELQLNYYMQDIFDKSVKDFKSESGKQVFIDNFKNELNRYKINGNWITEEFGQIEDQISEDGIELNEEKIVLKLNLELTGKQENDGKEVISVKYSYKKDFEKVFKPKNL